MADWLGDRRTEVAADRILDAAGQLLTHRDAATVGMNDVARAAGCSRATVYRYFENRDALHAAYVHREARQTFRAMGELIAGIEEPRARLLEGVLTSLRSVRESPSLASWFTSTQRPIGGQLADSSEVIGGLTEAFLRSLGLDGVEPRARWLIRVMVSLLVFPGRDDVEERAMLEDFVLPPVMAATPGPG